MTPAIDPTSDEITQTGALKAAVRYVRGELNGKLDEIETSLERNVALSCTACGIPKDQVALGTCTMTRDHIHRFASEVRLKEPA